MNYQLPPLPYSYDALEPYIDAQTMQLHYLKHHQGYIDKLNLALKDYPQYSNLSIEELLKNLNELPDEIKIQVKNQGGGHFNHSFFWPLMSPEKKEIDYLVLKLIEKYFSQFENFKQTFINTALNHFGSGWGWLVFNKNNNILEIYSTSNQDSPILENKIPLLGVDVWEHAYYLKYQNKRKDYLEAFWKIINWDKVKENFEKNNLI